MPRARPQTIFLLSPASTSGERAAVLLRAGADFPLAQRIRAEPGAPLGEVFSFLSALYFRGKLAYAEAFARPPRGVPGSLVITPSDGLRDPHGPITLERLRAWAEVPISTGEPRYLAPLLRDAEMLATAAPRSRIVLLGSVATARYVGPLLEVFGERLQFPDAFVGRGDMSRGGLMLRCVAAGVELSYVPVAGAARRGPRPARLPARPRG